MLTSFSRVRIRDIVAEQLRSYIVEERLRPGDRLPTETELAEAFGVSRPSVREATKALEFIGLVEAKPGRGLTVGSLQLERLTSFVDAHPDLQDTSPEQLIRTRTVIECGVLPDVIERMRDDPQLFETLQAINQQLRRARTLKAWIERDIAFHQKLVEASGLSPLVTFNPLLASFFGRFRESVKKAEWQQGVASHQRLLEGLRDGDLESAVAELRSHIESHRQRLDGASP